MKKIDIVQGMYYLEVPEEGLKLLCGCPENSIKFIMQKGLTPHLDPKNSNLVDGPNAILLNDLSILNSHYLNFAEFPVLHHQYFQGAAYNGTNETFTLIGIKDRVDHQYNYIRCGVQGITDKDELMQASLDESTAEKFLAMGRYHRGGNNSFNILNPVYISGKTKIKGELYIERLSLNRFKFYYKDQEEIIDLNLPSNAKGVGLPYDISHKLIKDEKFSVTTVGDGNGWNPKVPCLSSVITANGKKFLVDSGPGSLDLIQHLGISPSELHGVFLTHSHDDHFAGILSLLNAENKLRFFATPLVKTSIQKKFQSLLNFNKDDICCFIDFVELKEDKWIDIGEMEVKANYSFHTVETNIFYFRVLDKNNSYKTYGHITDILSKRDLDLMIKKDSTGVIKEDWAYKWFDKYLEPCDYKRIDAGGGPVHGDSNDFIVDKTPRIVLSHLDKDIDTSASSHFLHPTDFGYTETLLSADKNYRIDNVNSILDDIGFKYEDITDSDFVTKKPQEIIYHKGEQLLEIYLVVSGVVEAIDGSNYKRKYIKGDFLYTFNNEKSSKKDFISLSYTTLLKIDKKEFKTFIKKEKLNRSFNFLRESSIFTYGLSFSVLLWFSKIVKRKKIKKGAELELNDNQILIIEKGNIEVYKSDNKIDTLVSNSICVSGFSTKNCPRDKSLSLRVTKNTTVLDFNRYDIKGFVAMMWTIYEELKRAETIVEIGRI